MYFPLYKIVRNVVMLSGSFNPLHLGHEGIVEQALKRLELPCENYVYEVAVNNVDKSQIGIE